MRRAVLVCAAFLLAASAGAQETTYEKDARGRILAVTTAEGTTRYSYFEDSVIESVEHPDGTKETYKHEDILAGQAAAEASAEPKSPPRQSAFDLSHNRFAFTGHYFDVETGLYYAKARYYDPQTGRFITQDSHLGDLADPPSLHRYMYAHNNPTRFVDPTGHSDADANKLAAAMHQRIGVLASDHRPAYQRGWWYNATQEFYSDFPQRMLPMQHIEGMVNQDAEKFAKGMGETVVAAAIPPVVRRGVAAVVEKVPYLGKSVTEAAREALERIHTPKRALTNADVIGAVPHTEASGGSFRVTEDGMVPMGEVRGGSPADPARVTWVDEGGNLRAGGKPGMSTAAYEYQSEATGARSGVASGRSQAPRLSYTDPATGEPATVKFDAFDDGVLIDRKLSIHMGPKTRLLAQRQSAALSEHGYTGAWEVPTAAEAARATKLFAQEEITNITVRVAPK